MLPFCAESACETSTIVQGIEMSFVPVPLHRVWLTSDLVSGCFNVSVRSSFPIKGVEFIMGNDIAGGKVSPVLHVIDTPQVEMYPDQLAQKFPDVFSISAVSTRAQVKAACQGDEVDLSDTLLADVFEKGKLSSEQINVSNLDLETSLVPEMVAFLPVSRESLIGAQNNDSTLEKCRASVARLHSGKHQYYWHNDVLMRNGMHTR